MIKREIIFFGKTAILACDGNCEKAWGINNRPMYYPNGTDYNAEYVQDSRLYTAPIDPGTYEGDAAKPRNDASKLNKWCARECERSVICALDEKIELPVFN